MRMSDQTVTVCGLEELAGHEHSAITHVLSLLDPEQHESHRFSAFRRHERKLLNFHDIIESLDGKCEPARDHVVEILAYGKAVEAAPGNRGDKHLLIHCQMGVSRSTASALMLMAQSDPGADEAALFETLRVIRPQAWPNSVMIGYADDLLGRDGRLVSALRRHYGFQLHRDPSYAEWMRRLGRGREVEMALPFAGA